MQYTTKDGERLDAICRQCYGTTDGVFEAVLYDTTNYDITSSEVFNAGTIINLPAVSESQTIQTQKEYVLWE